MEGECKTVAGEKGRAEAYVAARQVRENRAVTVSEGMLMRAWMFATVLWMTALLAGCGGGGGANVTVTISPTFATVVVSTGMQQFSAVVNGSSNQNVTWSVNKIVGGNATVGTISTSGLYMAPATIPSPAIVMVTATSKANTSISQTANVTIDSGIRVTVAPTSATIGTSENLAITPTVTGSPSNTTVNWTVNGVPNGNTTLGQICVSNMQGGILLPCTAPSGAISGTIFYLAPATVPNQGSVTVTAKSAADTNQSANSALTVVAGTDPLLTAIDPSIASQGSVFQDIYLSGSNFLSTSTAQANGNSLLTTFISTTFLKVRVPDTLLAMAGQLSIVVQRQNGHTSGAQTLTVSPVRPAIVSVTPDSVPQNGPSFTASFNGGYYGTAANPAVTAEFNGQPRTGSVINTRQLNVTIQASDLSQAGLFPLVIRNNGVPAGSPAIATTNIAVEPVVGTPSPSTFTACPPVGAVCTQPSSVAINTATGTVVVANRGSNNISVFNLSSPGSVTTLGVGTAPTGVAVDNVRNIAAIVNSGSNTLTIINLAGTPTVLTTLALPAATTPFSVGLNPLTGRGLVVNSSTNMATVVDVTTPSSPSIVGTVSISTGPAPEVAIEPRLNWAVVTPGGAGSGSIVNLGRPASTGDTGLAPLVVARLFLSTTNFSGIAINTETEQALLTDPNSSSQTLFSVLDQTVSSFTLVCAMQPCPPLLGETAAAINPLTNMGVMVNSVSNIATVVDLRTKLSVTTVSVGTNPQAVAIDPASNMAVVANAGSNNVTLFSLGTIRPLHVTEISPASTFAVPSMSCAGAPPVALTVIGNHFVSGSVLRLDEVALPLADVTSVSVDGRQLTASIPACMVSKPRLYAVDVQNPDTTISNESRFSVIQAISVGTAPQGVAIDSAHELAVVTNSGSNTISIVDLNAGTASTPIAVGTNPQGVAVLPRLGQGGVALVANNGSNNASLIDLKMQQVTNTITVGSGPLGVAIQPDTAVAVVANTISNTISVFHIDVSGTVTSIGVDQRPESVAIDPLRNFAAVGNTTQQSVVLVDLSSNVLTGRPPCPQFQPSCFANPTGIAFDPVTDVFVVTSSLQNNLNIVDPGTLNVTPLLVGINPNSVDYNFQTGTVVTVNSESHTASVVDFQGQGVPAVLGHVAAVLNLDGSTQFSVAIDPRSNLAVVADQNNNRVLLVPLPR